MVENSVIIEYSKNPKWANETNSLIDIIVKFSHIADEVLFTANPNDCAEHGKQLYAEAITGKFGEIASFAPYVPPTEELAAIVRADRDQLLKDSDWTQLPDVPQATKDLWAIYRQALRDITAQEGFPNNVIWPTTPT